MQSIELRKATAHPTTKPMANLNFIKKALPWIGTAVQVALPGPLGNVAKILTDKLGKSVPADSTGIASTLEAALGDPALAEKLKEAEMQFQQAMQQQNFQHIEDLESIAAADRASARGREIALKDWYTKVLATLVVVLCFLGEGLYFRYGAPANASPELIGRILGTLDSALILILSYYFGSSAGSAAKNDIIASQQKG